MVYQESNQQCNSPTYGTATQYANPEENLAALPPEGVIVAIKIVGNFLYYALAVDSTILVSLRYLTSTQGNFTEKTYNAIVWLLNYADIHRTAVSRYNQSDLILQFHINVSYFLSINVCRRSGRYHYTSDDSGDPLENGFVHNV